MSSRRSRLSIYIDILMSIKKQEEMENKAKITRVIFDANLPYIRVKERLDELLKLGFIELVDGRYYKLTEKGRVGLLELIKAQKIIESLGFNI